MSDFPLEIGHECAITVFVDEEVITGVIHKRTGTHTVETSIFCEDAQTLRVASILLAAAMESISFQLDDHGIKASIKDIIERMRREIAEEEGEPPSPTDDLGDIPF